MSWDIFLTVSEMFGKEGNRLHSALGKQIHKRVRISSTLKAGGPAKLRNVRRGDVETCMLDTLSFHRRKLCAKPEDKVYGI